MAYQREDYVKIARKFVSGWKKEVSEHIIDIIVSVMMTRDNVQQGGSFVQAVVDNDLYGALSRADDDCFVNIKIIVSARENCFVNQLKYDI
jgi:hypothetical protein